MVISCPECSTRFRVEEGKIPAQGAKIRCARCKHIFAVTPPPPEPESIIERAIPPVVDEPAFTAEPPSATDDDFGFDDFGSPEVDRGANDELDPSAFDEDASVSDDNDAFSFGGDYGNVSLGDQSDAAEEDGPFSFGEPTPAPPHRGTDVEQEQFSFSPAQPANTDSSDPLADSFTEDSSLDDISMPPSEDAFYREDADTSVPQPISKSSSRSPVSVVMLFLLALILAVLIAGGFILWQSGPAGVEQLISKLTGQPGVSAVKGEIRLSNLQGSFITNSKEGELFVIHGSAINNHSEAQAAIQVKGVIFDKSGEQLLQKTIFCGNPISDNDLRKLPYSKMEEMMGNQFGESLANLNVTPNQSIPFTIVFRKLPRTLSEFVVEVADSKPAAQ